MGDPRRTRIWLDKYLLPTLADLPLDEITPTVVLRWYEETLPHDKPKTPASATPSARPSCERRQLQTECSLGP